MTLSKKSKMKRRSTRANALRLVLLSPLTSEARSRQSRVVPRPLLPLPQPPSLPSLVLRLPLSVRFRPPFLQLVQATSMLHPSESRRLSLQSLPQSNNWGSHRYVGYNTFFSGSYLSPLHIRTPGDRYPTRPVVMRVAYLYRLSYDTVSLPYVDLYTFTRVWLRPRLLIAPSAL